MSYKSTNTMASPSNSGESSDFSPLGVSIPVNKAKKHCNRGYYSNRTWYSSSYLSNSSSSNSSQSHNSYKRDVSGNVNEMSGKLSNHTPSPRNSGGSTDFIPLGISGPVIRASQHWNRGNYSNRSSYSRPYLSNPSSLNSSRSYSSYKRDVSRNVKEMSGKLSSHTPSPINSGESSDFIPLGVSSPVNKAKKHCNRGYYSNRTWYSSSYLSNSSSSNSSQSHNSYKRDVSGNVNEMSGKLSNHTPSPRNSGGSTDFIPLGISGPVIRASQHWNRGNYSNRSSYSRPYLSNPSSLNSSRSYSSYKRDVSRNVKEMSGKLSNHTPSPINSGESSDFIPLGVSSPVNKAKKHCNRGYYSNRTWYSSSYLSNSSSSNSSQSHNSYKRDVSGNVNEMSGKLSNHTPSPRNSGGSTDFIPLGISGPVIRASQHWNRGNYSNRSSYSSPYSSNPSSFNSSRSYSSYKRDVSGNFRGGKNFNYSRSNSPPIHLYYDEEALQNPWAELEKKMKDQQNTAPEKRTESTENNLLEEESNSPDVSGDDEQ